MKIGIYGAGKMCFHIQRDIPFIGVDGGTAALEKLGIEPVLIVGDFDSYKEKLNPAVSSRRLPCRKDFTDTEIAVMEAIQRGYDEIEMYGVTGGRLDHFFAVCRLLVKYRDIQITVYDDENQIVLLKPGQHQIQKNGYTYLSFFAADACHLTLKNVAYPLDNYDLQYQDSLCVSNEIIGESAQVICDGYLFCLQTNES